MKRLFQTDSGMLCIWDYNSFKHINDYDSWDKELCEDEDIQKHINSSKFVPLNLGDGAFDVEIRFTEPSFSDREREYLLVPSQPYKIVSDGQLCISGLEHVCGDLDDNIANLSIKPGEYIAQINLIDWNQEPGATDSDGNPTDKALPDMIIFIYNDHSINEFRKDIETFRREDALR